MKDLHGLHGQGEFSFGNSFPGTQCPQTQDCLPALLIIHSLWLSSLLPVGSVWFGMGDSYLQSREIRVFMFQRTCSVGVWPRWGPEHPEWVTCPHPCHLQLLGHPYWVIAAVLSPPLAPGNKLMAARNNWGDECGSWSKLCCPRLTWTHSLKILEAIQSDQMQPLLDVQAT